MTATLRLVPNFNPNHDELGRFAEGSGEGRELNKSEIAAVDSYTGGGYGNINNTLRTDGFGDPNAFDATDERNRIFVAGLDSAIASTVPLAAPATVYRGVSAKAVGGALPGMTVMDKGFVSTSLNRTVAQKFVNHAGLGKGVLAEITLPKGAQVLNIGARGHGYGNEKEVLLGRGSRFKVTGVELNTPSGTPRIKMTLIV